MLTLKKSMVFLIVVIASLVFSYNIRVGDVLKVEVVEYPELTRECEVDIEGSISFPYTGRMKVVGKTIEEISASIQEILSEKLGNPNVLVSLVKLAPRLVYVSGVTNNTVDLGYETPSLSKFISMMGINLEQIDLSSIKLVKRDGTTLTIDLSGILLGSCPANDPSVEEGDQVILPEKTVKESVKVLGAVRRPGIYDYQVGMKLVDLIGLAGGLEENSSGVASINRNKNVIQVNLENVLSGIEELEILPGDVVYVPEEKERFAYILGAVARPGVYMFSKEERLTLRNLLSKAGGLSAKLEFLETIVVTSGDGQTKEYDPRYVATGEKEIALQIGDFVYVKEYEHPEVTVLGAVRNPGVFPISPKGGVSIHEVIAKAGGISKELEKLDEIVVSRDGTSIAFQPEEVLGEGKDFQLFPGDIVQVKEYTPRRAYILGYVRNPGLYSFEKNEKFTLRELITKAGGFVDEEKVKSLKVVGDVEKIYSVKEALGKEVELKRGVFVYVEPVEDRFVYVTGLVSKPGLVSFLPSEEMTLSKALAKAGGVPSGDTDRVDRIIVKRRNGNIARLDWEEVLSGATDASLEIGDTVMVEKVKERYIYVLGDNPQRNGKMVFEPKEAFTLAVALKKYGIEDVALLDKVELIRKGKAVSIPPDRALFDERELLVGDTVVVKMKDSTRIYITGDVFAYVTFNPEENPTLNKALAKAGGFDERYLKGLKIVKKDGETVLLKKVVPFELDDGDVIEVDLYETSRIYVGGFVKSPGLVVFQPDEEPSLKKALARAGGVLETEDNVADKAVIVRNGERKSYNVESILLGEIDVVLQDGDYITVTWRNLRYAFAFGEGVRNGKVIFKDEEEFNVKNLLGKVGGLNEKASKKIEVIMPNGDTQTINFEDVLKGGGPELENGAMVLIPEETEDYVYVLGEVRSPGAYRLKGDVRLYQVISWAGGLSDWAAKTKVVLKRGGEEKEYDMDDLSSVEGVKILPGDVVYVPPIETNIVYVFGEVNRPSIVRIDRYSTVFDAVMKSGGFTKDAAYSKVFLFKGGSEKDAVICDLSGMVTGKGGFVNPSVGPGDIIYVSRSPTMELPEVIAVVKNLMDIISTSKSILGW